MKILNMRNKRLSVEGKDIELTPSEAQILSFLSNNFLITYADFKKYLKIKSRVTMAIHIKRIRDKTNVDIESKMGRGYILKEEICIDY